ncbi:hypothetical protein BLOT_003392 [Blomia tropicalis]|nr:hypothetical protein BLOT_003392 [Blomia tropicalis]
MSLNALNEKKKKKKLKTKPYAYIIYSCFSDDQVATLRFFISCGGDDYDDGDGDDEQNFEE